jgi:hypothetical protein
VRRAAAVATLALLALPGCASSRARGGGGGPVSEVTADVGVGTAPDIDRKAREVLGRYRFQIVRVQPPPDIYYETEWLRRDPFDDERSAGAEAAQSRVIVRARQRGLGISTSSIANTFAIDVTVENMVRAEGGADFRPAPVTAAFRAFAKKLTDELELELRSGLRRG